MIITRTFIKVQPFKLMKKLNGDCWEILTKLMSGKYPALSKPTHNQIS